MGGNSAPYRHIWLYAKWQYAWGDLIKDLRTIVAYEEGRPPGFVSEKDILAAVCSVVAPLLFVGGDSASRLCRIFSNLLEESKNGPDNEQAPFDLEIIIRQLLSEIMIARTEESGEIFVEIGEPVPSLLPQIVS